MTVMEPCVPYPRYLPGLQITDLPSSVDVPCQKMERAPRLLPQFGLRVTKSPSPPPFLEQSKSLVVIGSNHFIWPGAARCVMLGWGAITTYLGTPYSVPIYGSSILKKQKHEGHLVPKAFIPNTFP